jgi:N-formylglutamate amidohydrolase
MNLPFVISLPHCSSRIPKEVMSALALTHEEIMESTDLGTKEIFGAMPYLPRLSFVPSGPGLWWI